MTRLLFLAVNGLAHFDVLHLLEGQGVPVDLLVDDTARALNGLPDRVFGSAAFSNPVPHD